MTYLIHSYKKSVPTMFNIVSHFLSKIYEINIYFIWLLYPIKNYGWLTVNYEGQLWAHVNIIKGLAIHSKIYLQPTSFYRILPTFVFRQNSPSVQRRFTKKLSTTELQAGILPTAYLRKNLYN